MEQLIGSSNFDRQIERIKSDQSKAVSEYWLDFFGYKYLVLWNGKNGNPPIVFHSFESDEPSWVLSEDSRQWRFYYQPVTRLIKSQPSRWSYPDFCLQIGRFAPHTSDETELDRIRAGHFKALSLWLLFDGLVNCSEKDSLRELLHTTDLIQVKSYADYSLARRTFARQIYPYSELAQRAGSEEHLWFCMEYSSYLQKLEPCEATKGDVERGASKSLNFCRQALKDAEIGKPLEAETIDDLIAEGIDWRLHIETLLIYDAIRLVYEAEGGSVAAKDMKHHTSQFLNAIGHLNEIRHSSDSVILRQLPNGEATKTKPGRPSKNHKKRGKGRPPKGSC